MSADTYTDIPAPYEQLGPELSGSINGPGARLRTQRLARGWDLAEASKQSGVRVPFLTAIEKGQADQLPSTGYVLGYVRTYAKAMGLDGPSAVARYKIDSEVPENLGMRDRPHFVPRRKIRLPRALFPALTVIAVAAMLTVWYGMQTETQAAILNGPDLTPRSIDTPAIVNDPNMVTVKVLAPSWIQIKDDKGRVIISRIFVTGETWQTQRGSGASISARDGGAVQIFVGQGDAGLLGTQGVAVNDIPLAN